MTRQATIAPRGPNTNVTRNIDTIMMRAYMAKMAAMIREQVRKEENEKMQKEMGVAREEMKEQYDALKETEGQLQDTKSKRSVLEQQKLNLEEQVGLLERELGSSRLSNESLTKALDKLQRQYDEKVQAKLLKEDSVLATKAFSKWRELIPKTQKELMALQVG